MEMLLGPIVSVMDRLRLKQKFILISTIIVIAGAGLLATIGYELQRQLDDSHSEQLGIEYTKVASEVLDQWQGTQLSDVANRRSAVEALNASTANLSTFQSPRGTLKIDPLPVVDDAGVGAKGVGSTLPALFRQIADRSKLTLDTELDSYYLMSISTHVIPSYIRDAANLATADGPQRHLLVTQLRSAIDRIATEMDIVRSVNPGVATTLSGELEQLLAEKNTFDQIEKKATAANLSAVIQPALVLQRSQVAVLDKLLSERIDRTKRYRSLIFSLSALAAMLAAYAVAGFYLGMRRSLDGISDAAEAIAAGRLDHMVVVAAHDEAGQAAGAIRDMQAHLRDQLTAEREIASANRRIREALDRAGAAVVVCDAERVIVYGNLAAKQLLEAGSVEFRKLLPDFDVSEIVGLPLDWLTPESAVTQAWLDALDEPSTLAINVGERSYLLSASPVVDDEGTRSGCAVEWRDTTSELAQKKQQELEAADHKSQLAAIGRVQGVIEFDLTGRVLKANSNFLDLLGYSASELIGNQHSMLVEPNYRASPEYHQFWERLRHGEHDAGRYMRIAKGGRQVWIQASYNPIPDESGKPYKVVKYATDITEQMRDMEILRQAVEQTQKVVSAAKEGDLNQRISVDDKEGAVKELCDGINSLVDSMAEVVEHVRGAVEPITTAAREIATGSTDLSSRTEQQAASLEQTASSMEELTSTVKQNADNAIQANHLAIGAAEVAAKGGSVVGNVVETMAAINQASKKIVDIISVIDGIAFQTNILALNAAVEAARAGEQGRGFAVVAGEVRNLAQRSASAAKEIKSLIGDSVDKVTNGTQLVEQAGATMAEIVASVKRVTDIMAEISAASQEQSRGIEQVNQTIAQMEEVTQQNAALVGEAAASANSLETQAEALTTVVDRFSLRPGTEDVLAGLSMATPPQAPQTVTPPAAAPSGASLIRGRRAASPRGSRILGGRRDVPLGRAPLNPASDQKWTEF